MSANKPPARPESFYPGMLWGEYRSSMLTEIACLSAVGLGPAPPVSAASSLAEISAALADLRAAEDRLLARDRAAPASRGARPAAPPPSAQGGAAETAAGAAAEAAAGAAAPPGLGAESAVVLAQIAELKAKGFSGSLRDLRAAGPEELAYERGLLREQERRAQEAAPTNSRRAATAGAGDCALELYPHDDGGLLRSVSRRTSRGDHPPGGAAAP